jgi:VanZ family protein
MPDSALFSIRFLDKIVHFSLYAFFGFIALLESRCQIQCIRFHMLLILTIFIMSAVIEILQATVVATRSAEWLDLLANFSGLVAGYIAFRMFHKLFRS